MLVRSFEIGHADDTRHAARTVQYARPASIIELYADTLSHNLCLLSEYADSYACQIIVVEHLDEVVRYFCPCAVCLCP